MSTLSVNDSSLLTGRSSGWLISLAAHLVAVSIAAFLMNNLRVTLPPDTFRWDIALVAPPKVPIAPASSVRPSPPQQVNEAHGVQQRVASPPHQQRIVKTQPVTQVIQKMSEIIPQEVRAIEPVTRVKPGGHDTTHSQLAHEMSEVIPQEVRAIEPVTRVKPGGHDTTHSQLAHESEVQHKSEIVETTLTSPVLSQADRHPVTDHSSSVITKAVAVEFKQLSETADSSAIERLPVLEETLGTLQTPMVESRQEPTENAISQKASATQQFSVPLPVIEPVLHAAIHNTPVQAKHAVKPDYGWLVEALWSRVERFKRYPYLARTNRWEGMVVLQAVINQEGQLLDLKVAESSGHQLLDQDAMDVMRRSCPLHLDHPLGRSQVVVNVPINYKLH